jgi:hypothetical protein
MVRSGRRRRRSGGGVTPDLSVATHAVDGTAGGRRPDAELKATGSAWLTAINVRTTLRVRSARTVPDVGT